MEIRIRATGAVMYENEFRAYVKEEGGPTWVETTPEILDELGADAVLEGPQVTPTTPYEFSMRQGVEEIEGKWYTKYVLGPVFYDIPEQDGRPAQTAAEQEAAYRTQKDKAQADAIRATRANKLKDCDWTQLDDTPLTNSKKLEWATYRQALRDISSQPGFPWDVSWPVAP